MRPIRTNTTPRTYSGGSMDNVADLPCMMDPAGTTAIFKLSPEERDRLLDGGLIELRVTGHPLPPVSLNITTANVKEEWQDDDLLCTNCKAVWKVSRGFTTCNHCGGKLEAATEVIR